MIERNPASPAQPHGCAPPGQGGRSATWSPMKVTVDFELCQSHGLCTQNVPEVFEIRDDGFLYILQETPPESLRARLQTAVRECPTGAITVSD